MSGELIALISAALWAFSTVLLAMSTRTLHVVPLNLVRCTVATAFFWSLLPFFGGLPAVAAIPAGRWLGLVASVLMLLIIGDLLYFQSMSLAGVSWTAPVASINPLWAVLLAAIFIDEPLTPRLVAGAVLVIAGVVLVSRSTSRDGAGDGLPQKVTGLLLALAASLAWGIGQVILKQATAGIESAVVNSVRQPIGALMMLGLNAARGRWGELRQLDRRSWLVIVTASAVGTGLGSLLFIEAIQMVGAGRTAVLTSTTPLLAIPFAMLVLHERPNRLTVVGAVLAVVGVALVA